MSSLLMRLHAERKDRLQRMNAVVRPPVVVVPKLPAVPLMEKKKLNIEKVEEYHKPFNIRSWFWPAEVQPTREELKVRHVIKCVSNYFRISIDDIVSEKRDHMVSRTRQVICYLAKELTPASYVLIGQMLNKDHSTILHAHRKLSMDDPDVRFLRMVLTNER